MLAGPSPTDTRPPVRRPRFGSMRTTEFTCGSAAHTLPPPTATSWHRSGTAIRRLCPDRGSTLTTLLDVEPATQTAPSPTATPRGPGPTIVFRRTRFVAGSICTSVWSTSFVTHTRPYPTATPNGP